MNAETMRDLLVRTASGDTLTAAEQQTLLDWLDTRPDARVALLADEAVDSDLRRLGTESATEDDFVAATLSRIAAQHEQPVEHLVVRRAPERPKSKSHDRSSWRQGLVAALASAVVVLSVALGWAIWHKRNERMEAQRTDPSRDARPSEAPSPGESPANESLANQRRPETNSPVPLTFVRLAGADDARWSTPLSVGQRLDPGTLRLEQGSAALEYDSGIVAHIAAPAVLELVSPTELRLNRGTVSAHVPPLATGFTVTTPVARVIDLGTEFDVAVAESGNTETHVRRGKVSFRPQRNGEPPGKALELIAEGLDRAQATIPDVTAPILPVSTIFSGDQGEFLATICAQGKTIEFSTREAFDDYRTHLVRQLRESPADFSQQWSIMVAASSSSGTQVTTAAGGSGRTRTATVRENDQTVSLTETNAGITIRIVTTVDGKPHVREITASSAEELEQKDAAAFRLYQRHLGGDAAAPGTMPPLPGAHDPRKMLRDHLRQQLENNNLDPNLRGMLERMQRQFDN